MNWGRLKNTTKNEQKENSTPTSFLQKYKNSHRHDGLRRCGSGHHLQVGGDDVLEREPAGGRGAAFAEEEREGCREGRRFFKDDDDECLSLSFSSFRGLSAELIHYRINKRKLVVTKKRKGANRSAAKQFAFVCFYSLISSTQHFIFFNSQGLVPPPGSPLPLPLPRCRGAEPPPTRDQCPGGGPLEAGAAAAASV